MIDRFIIKNYQIIRKGEILIRPGITLITGPSNNGKSSIFKAYKQLVYNLSGNTYINQFANECELILDNNAYTIEYRKSKTKSSYDIKIVNPETTLHIDKLGANQLDKIKDLTQIDKELGYNFWDQLEKPFLLNRTNREQFLLLQESPISSNLLSIQETIKSDIKSLKDEILVSQGSLDVVNSNLAKQKDILDHSNLVHEISSKASDLNSLNGKLNSLMTKVRDFSSAEKELDSYKDIGTINFDTNIEDTYTQFKKFNESISEFTKVSKMIGEETETSANLRAEIDKIDEIFDKYFNICPLCGHMIEKIS